MIKCVLCGKEFKVISPLHLKRVHGITMAEYRKQFPDAPIYSPERYAVAEDVGILERGKTNEELGLMILHRYRRPDDKQIIESVSSEIRSTADMQEWCKKSRERIEQLFRS